MKRSQKKMAQESAPDALLRPCQHPAKKHCGLCGEFFCQADGCDPHHRENCIEARRP